MDEDEMSSPVLPDVWRPLERWMELHPRYGTLFRLTIDQLFYGNGPLTMSDRHYIALMAACRHRCHFLEDLHSREFLRLGGDSRWLEGCDSAPSRISALDLINRLLAHQPWTVTVDEMTALTRCPGDKWSLSALMQAAVLLASTHALCSFVFACGDIEPSKLPRVQLSLPGRVMTLHFSGDDAVSPGVIRQGKGGEVEELMARMQQLKNRVQKSEEEDRARRFADVHREASSLVPCSSNNATSILPSNSPVFSKMPCFGYVDFAQRCTPDASPTLKIHDFSWQDHGFSCICEFYQDLAELLDAKFHLTQELTYNTMGSHENVDTSKYRTAIWMYIQSLYGIRHDDYDYAEVNVMLSRDMKVFIKTACCFPDRCTSELRASVMPDFQISERVHVVLMIAESRLQAELLYLVRALTRQLNNHH